MKYVVFEERKLIDNRNIFQKLKSWLRYGKFHIYNSVVFTMSDEYIHFFKQLKRRNNIRNIMEMYTETYFYTVTVDGINRIENNRIQVKLNFDCKTEDNDKIKLPLNLYKYFYIYPIKK